MVPIPKDPKRTGVRARPVESWEGRDPGGFLCGLPGDVKRTSHADGTHYGFLIACPGCGVLGGIALADRENESRNWRVTGGDAGDVTTLSLEPSIRMGCCGWHGHLRSGVFESC